MVTMRWNKNGRERFKDIDDVRVPEYIGYGWEVVRQGADENPLSVPAITIETITQTEQKSPLDKLEKAVNAVVDNPKKRGRGRHPRR